MTPPVVRFEQVSVRYPGQRRPALDAVDLAIPEGDLCLVVGRTGSGKSTLLGAVNGLVPHFSGGELSGRVSVAGRDTARFRPRELADVVGFVPQNPVTAFVTDRVEDEIAYGMEQLGLSHAAMRKRVEEALDLLGIADLRRRALLELSGGQQQRVAIASVLAAQPRVLVLDEPTSALDPTAANEVLSAVSTLVHDVGLTVVLAEHRLERVTQFADSIVWLPGDGTALAGPPGDMLARADVRPPLARLAHRVGWRDVPVSVRDARRRAQAEHLADRIRPASHPSRDTVAAPAIEIDHLGVRYGQVVAVDDAHLSLRAAGVTAVMGRNGSGKSSLLWAIAGAIPSSGTLSVTGVDTRAVSADAARKAVCLVPQSAADLLYLPTVAAECAQSDAESGQPSGTCAALLADLGFALDLDADPRDLSEGQRLALVLAIQLTGHPPVVLLDEPTRGLDYEAKDRLARILGQLRARGVCVVVSTHDVEFVAPLCDRTVLLAAGEVIADGPTREIIASSPAYAPQLAKVFHPHPVLTPDDIAGPA